NKTGKKKVFLKKSHGRGNPIYDERIDERSSAIFIVWIAIIYTYLTSLQKKPKIQTFSLVFVIFIRVSILILIFYRGNAFFFSLTQIAQMEEIRSLKIRNYLCNLVNLWLKSFFTPSLL
ncbi:MAG: hypothetical protein KJ893_09440, partial [Candidatus Omnitrophica bacterium]|nr:hypothetical protein [Candidatus Omnitrophota bacterium]